MSELVGWIAPFATAVAALMTASNLGARVTGWGFAVFVLASISWCTVALSTGQSNLLWANGFLTLVNAFGVWRWLGRKAQYERGGDTASKRSHEAAREDLLRLSALVGASVNDAAGEAIGQVAEVMLGCRSARPAYLVVSTGGVAGLGETLHALGHEEFSLTAEGVRTAVTRMELKTRPPLTPDSWPV